MELNTIKDSLERVVKKQKGSYSKSQDIIDQIGQLIEQALSRIQSGSDSASPTDHKLILSELKCKLTENTPLRQLEAAQREVSIALTKYPKLLEKSFNADISKAYRNIDFDTQTLNKIIATHLYQSGQFDVGDSFVDDCKLPELAMQKSTFQELFHIVETMRARYPHPAFDWVINNHDQLDQIGSDIELKLHCPRFVDLLQENNRDAAMKYAIEFFTPLASKYASEVQKLMGCLLWGDRLEKSPYAELVSSLQWEKVAEELRKNFCEVIGRSSVSPLHVTVEAGVQAMPTLLKLMNVMMGGKMQEWQSAKQLPVAVDLDREFQFHSVFVCPVSREQASEENPPLLLSCGHVLCKQSVAKLCKSNVTRPFKCPYCPAEVEAGKCKQLYL